MRNVSEEKKKVDPFPNEERFTVSVTKTETPKIKCKDIICYQSKGNQNKEK